MFSVCRNSNPEIYSRSVPDPPVTHTGRCWESISDWVGLRTVKSGHEPNCVPVIDRVQQYIATTGHNERRVPSGSPNRVQKSAVCTIHDDVRGGVGWVVLSHDGLVHYIRQSQSRQSHHNQFVTKKEINCSKLLYKPKLMRKLNSSRWRKEKTKTGTYKNVNKGFQVF